MTLWLYFMICMLMYLGIRVLTDACNLLCNAQKKKKKKRKDEKVG